VNVFKLSLLCPYGDGRKRGEKKREKMFHAPW
jgi:hypothetical protein